MKKVIVVYIPVLHAGYISFLQRHQPADIILLTADSVVSIDPVIADQWSRDIRCLPVDSVASYLSNVFQESTISVFLGIDCLKSYTSFVMLDEDISHVLERKIHHSDVVFDNQFLRWDWTKAMVQQSVVGVFPLSHYQKHILLMEIAFQAAAKGPDWWRRVGAVMPVGDTVIVAYNHHLPTNDTSYVFGDPRLIMKPGESPHICAAIHGEMSVFAQSLKKGISTDGRDLFVTTFPCPVCARMIAGCGIKRLFFAEGYSILDAAEILLHAGVEIFQVLVKV